MTWLGSTFRIGGTSVAFGVVLMLLLYLGVWFWLRETAAGRHVYAVGNNPEATRLTGIATERVLLAVYVLAACSTASRRCCRSRRTGVGDPNAGQTENLDAITAVVLGGTSLFGGRGRHPRLADRRGDRRRAAQRAHADGNALGLPGADHRHPGDPRGGHRPTLAQGRPLMSAQPKLVMQAKGLVKRYGHVTALDGADFELRAGEILAVIGDNGAGKSSLIKALSGATIPDEGEILLDGRPIHFRSPIGRAPRRHRDGVSGPGRRCRR
jgi:ABC-type multidrug transport system fused ATPase/permease subunit